MALRKIGTKHIEKIAHQMAINMMSWDEPIPSFKTRRPKVLESCLATPFQTYNRRDLYASFEEKAAILFYLMVKNHPFQNGNKRIAVTALIIFFLLNEMWISVPPEKLYNLAVWVAESDPDLRNAVVMGLKDFTGKYAKKIKG